MSVSDTVRLALPAEAVDVARIQRRAWAESGLLAAAGGGLPADEAARVWHEAIVKPPLAHLRVLVAIGDDGVVGFAVTGPSGDPDREERDGTIAEFVVDPRHRGAGHGSRLMNAAVDTLRQDGYEVATMWVRAADDGLRAFLVACGWAPDGAHQEIATADGAPGVKLVRLHTDIRAAS
ncbi:Mycothiol acetyltransferase [Tessaracoccus sp. O5.2]|uniref:GNAT family N-acetyltransferase n=1 Tax=Tessaracoccus sp. O5.2 TaxID=3157622 RepID=UPI0035EC9746